MERSGYQVTKVELDDLSGIKAKYGVPVAVRDCHTAIVGDYFIEGHVPVKAVERLLRENPRIAGLALPGMPSGSAGMTGPKRGPFVVLQVNLDGTLEEFGRY